MFRIDRQPMSPLRRRYVDDLRLRNKSPRTIETDVLRVVQFARHFGKSPEALGPADLRAYQQHRISRGVSWSTFSQTVCALRFLYQVTLGRPRLQPGVLGPDEFREDSALRPGRSNATRRPTKVAEGGLGKRKNVAIEGLRDYDDAPRGIETPSRRRVGSAVQFNEILSGLLRDRPKHCVESLHAEHADRILIVRPLSFWRFLMKPCMLTLSLFGLLIVATSQAQDDIAKDRKAIQGTWVVVSAELDGKSADFSKGDKFTFSGDKATIENKVKKTDPVVFNLDPSKNPKQIDFEEKTPSKGIYELKVDELKLFYGTKRPAGFKSTTGLLLVLKRQK